MLKITNGRKSFYQWDVGQSLTLTTSENETVTEVHIGRGTNLYCVEPINELIAVYDELLQVPGTIVVYEHVNNVDEGHTIRRYSFEVIARPKVDNYEYTPTESYSWEWWCNRAKEYAEEAKQYLDDIPEAMQEYWSENKEQFMSPAYDDTEIRNEINDVKENLNELNDNVESLETNKADKSELDGKVGFTDYATQDQAGLVKGASGSGIYIGTGGQLGLAYLTADEYKTRGNYYAITKGTLENVLAERLKEPQFELIEEITLTEDAKLSRSAEPNGNPYNFKSIRVFLTVPSVASSSTNYISLSPSFDWDRSVGSFLMSSSQVVRFKANADIVGGLLSSLSGYNQGGSEASSMTSGIYLNSIRSSITKITSITGISSYIALPTGTNIKIYGIRA